MDTEGMIWAGVGVFLVLAMIISISFIIVSTDRKIAEMVKAGQNPLVAACALRAESRTCIAAASQR